MECEDFPPSPSWNSWITCSTGSGAGGRRRTWSCCCSAAVKCSTGWARSCCSARGWASAPTCSRSSSRSLPCELGGAAGGGPCGAQPGPERCPPPSCKQNQDMLSFYAIVIGLNNAAVSRLRLTWEVRAGAPLPPPHGAPRSSCAFLNTSRCSLTLSWAIPDHPWVLPVPSGSSHPTLHCSQDSGCSQTTPGCSLTPPGSCQEPQGGPAHTWLLLEPLLGSFQPPVVCSWNLPGTLFPLSTHRTSLGAPGLPLDVLTPLSSAPRTLWLLPDPPWVLPDTAQVFPGPLGCSCPHLAAPRALLGSS